jgi:hypothetical protein
MVVFSGTRAPASLFTSSRAACATRAWIGRARTSEGTFEVSRRDKNPFAFRAVVVSIDRGVRPALWCARVLDRARHASTRDPFRVISNATLRDQRNAALMTHSVSALLTSCARDRYSVHHG